MKKTAAIAALLIGTVCTLLGVNRNVSEWIIIGAFLHGAAIVIILSFKDKP